MSKVSCALIIHGRVQGVCMRAMCKEQASMLRLGGYARNNEDDTVSVMLLGEQQAVRNFIDWVQGSPGASRVSKVDVHWGEWYHGREQFSIMY